MGAGACSVGGALCLPGMDEFFAQGDREKELEIPVGMLNDREKVNRRSHAVCCAKWAHHTIGQAEFPGPTPRLGLLSS